VTRVGARQEVARAVLDAVEAAQKAADALWTAVDTANRLGVACPGFRDLMRTRSLCLQVASEHSTARVLAGGELGLNNTKKGA